MKTETIKTLRAFLIELAVYAVLVIAYFFLVLHFLGNGLRQLEVNHRYTYAGVSILLIPIYTSRLSRVEYGDYGLCQTLYWIVPSLMSLGLSAAGLWG